MVKHIFPSVYSNINHRWWELLQYAFSIGLISTFLDSVSHSFSFFLSAPKKSEIKF